MRKAFVLTGIALYLSLMPLRVAGQESQSPKLEVQNLETDSFDRDRKGT